MWWWLLVRVWKRHKLCFNDSHQQNLVFQRSVFIFDNTEYFVRWPDLHKASNTCTVLLFSQTARFNRSQRKRTFSTPHGTQTVKIHKQQNYDGYSTKKWQGNANWKRSVDVLNSCKLPQSNLLFYDNYKAFNNTGRKRKEESKVKTSLIWTEPSVGTYTGNCWSCCWHLQSSDHTKTRKKTKPSTPHAP